ERDQYADGRGRGGEDRGGPGQGRTAQSGRHAVVVRRAGRGATARQAGYGHHSQQGGYRGGDEYRRVSPAVGRPHARGQREQAGPAADQPDQGETLAAPLLRDHRGGQRAAGDRADGEPGAANDAHRED